MYTTMRLPRSTQSQISIEKTWGNLSKKNISNQMSLGYFNFWNHYLKAIVIIWEEKTVYMKWNWCKKIDFLSCCITICYNVSQLIGLLLTLLSFSYHCVSRFIATNQNGRANELSTRLFVYISSDQCIIIRRRLM